MRLDGTDLVQVGGAWGWRHGLGTHPSETRSGHLHAICCRAPRTAEAASADERAVADDGSAAEEDGADGTVHLEALVRRVVARVVEVGGADRPPSGRVEEDDIGILASFGRAFGRQPERRAGVVERRSTIRSRVMRPLATPSL